MQADLVIEPARTADIATVRALLEEYCAWIAIDLAFQEIDAELEGLPGAYAPPGGLILLARMRGETVGMAAYRRLDARTCEMKRLYIQGPARGLGLSRVLVTTLMEHARGAGYELMYLDTLPKMDRASSSTSRWDSTTSRPTTTHRSPAPGSWRAGCHPLNRRSDDLVARGLRPGAGDDLQLWRS